MSTQWIGTRPVEAGREPLRTDHLSFFNAPAYHALGLEAGERYHRVDYRLENRLVGSLAGVAREGAFCSGWRAPFGGPDFVRDRESVAGIADLLEHAVATLEDEGFERVEIRTRPACYSPIESQVHFVLMNLGFEVVRSELNFHIDLDRHAEPSAYVAALGDSARNMLRRTLDEPFRFRRAESDQDFAVAYGILAANRRAKGRPIRISLGYLERLRRVMPGMRMDLLEHAGAPCAAALRYRIRPGRELLVAWGDAHHALRRSPMNLLAYRIVEELIGEGVACLDLGIASEEGRANPGLVQFKRSLLARPSLRLDFARQTSRDGSGRAPRRIPS